MADLRYTPPRARRAGENRGGAYDDVRRSIYLLYKRLSPEVIGTYRASIPPGDITVHPYEDLPGGTRRVVRGLVAHLGLPGTRIVVGFRAMPPGRAGMVTLGRGPEYLVEVDVRFARRREDIGAVLAHEVMHVFLRHCDLRTEDEILVDTATAYLGTGWPLLNSGPERLGYLTPAQLGYVLGKRAVRFGDDPEPYLRTAEARFAYRAGRTCAAAEHHRPPFHTAGPRSRRRYEKARTRRLPRSPDGYAFSGHSPARVTFPCPTCNVQVTAPSSTVFWTRCTICHTPLDCAT